MSLYLVNSFVLELPFVAPLLSYFLFFDDLLEFLLLFFCNHRLLLFELIFAHGHVKFITIFYHLQERILFREFSCAALTSFGVFLFLFLTFLVIEIPIHYSKSHIDNTL